MIVGRREYPSQDVDSVLGRFSRSAREAGRLYREFIKAGFGQGRREEFQGDGLVRSAGGVEAGLSRRIEDREAADPRILGGGGFVEEVWAKSEAPKRRTIADLDGMLSEVSETTGVSREEVLGPSQARRAAAARRLF